MPCTVSALTSQTDPPVGGTRVSSEALSLEELLPERCLSTHVSIAAVSKLALYSAVTTHIRRYVQNPDHAQAVTIVKCVLSVNSSFTGRAASGKIYTAIDETRSQLANAGRDMSTSDRTLWSKKLYLQLSVTPADQFTSFTQGASHPAVRN